MSTLPATPQLSFTRDIDTPIDRVWKAWTDPQWLMKWFTPVPWKTIDCEIDLRPGGIFRTTMLSPEGEQFPNMGCYLEVVPERKLVWTNALLPGYQPAPPITTTHCGTFYFTAMLTLEPLTALGSKATGTRYTATVLHADEAGCKQHEEMGFNAGWNAALDQLIAVAKSM